MNDVIAGELLKHANDSSSMLKAITSHIFFTILYNEFDSKIIASDAGFPRLYPTYIEANDINNQIISSNPGVDWSGVVVKCRWNGGEVMDLYKDDTFFYRGFWKEMC